MNLFRSLSPFALALVAILSLIGLVATQGSASASAMQGPVGTTAEKWSVGTGNPTATPVSPGGPGGTYSVKNDGPNTVTIEAGSHTRTLAPGNSTQVTVPAGGTVTIQAQPNGVGGYYRATGSCTGPA
ncbi:MAG: hypothetical protein ACKVWV_14125 [Planctomycetota bacterium]